MQIVGQHCRLDVALQVVEGKICGCPHSAIADTLGDGVDANDLPFATSFPYLALPWSGSDATGWLGCR